MATTVMSSFWPPPSLCQFTSGLSGQLSGSLKPKRAHPTDSPPQSAVENRIV
jgi:hypothetical protein